MKKKDLPAVIACVAGVIIVVIVVATSGGLSNTMTTTIFVLGVIAGGSRAFSFWYNKGWYIKYINFFSCIFWVANGILVDVQNGLGKGTAIWLWNAITMLLISIGMYEKYRANKKKALQTPDEQARELELAKLTVEIQKLNADDRQLLLKKLSSDTQDVNADGPEAE